MSKTPLQNKTRAIPAGRVARFGHFGAMTASVAGNMAVQGLTQLGRGQKPVMKDLFLTPRNIARVTEQLSKMRGAAMKIGQLISMDTGDILPRELAQIMARLRDDAYSMPPAQLKQVLNAQLPNGWLSSFRKFDVHPIAAASIGQVHRAQLKDGRDVVLKIQYPGVASSIDSDVANVGVLMRLSGVLPAGFELAPYLEEARKQLHDETDYAREAAQIVRFRDLLKGAARLSVPEVHLDWSTPQILVMDYMAGHLIEDLAAADQKIRDRVMTDLIDLAMSELFDFGLMQTDPNFANYLYDSDERKVVLLDFGAVREIDPVIADQYRALMSAGLSGHADGLAAAAQDMGVFAASTQPQHRARLLHMLAQVFDMIRAGGAIDFTNQALSKQLQVDGLALFEDGFSPPVLPLDIVLIQRKFAGLFLLGAQLKACVDVNAILRRFVGSDKV